MVTYRQMSVADVPDVFGIRVSTLENVVTMSELEEEYELTPATLAEAMQESAKGWVCEVDDRIVGFAMGDSETGEMTVLAVLPEFERRGIGKKLLVQVQEWLFESGHKQLWLVTTPNPSFRAYGFYLSQGWRATGEIIDGEDEKFVLWLSDS